MTDRDKNSSPDQNRPPGEGDDTIIPGRHGKHGGSLESEGSPQEPSRESGEPARRNGDDRNRH